MTTKTSVFIFILCCTLLFIAGCSQKTTQENAKTAVSSENPANVPEAAKPADGAALTLAGEKVVKVGFIAPLTGDFGAYGRHMENAFKLAVEERNYRAGDFTIKIAIADDQSDAGKADEAAAKLINEEKVAAIVGSFTYNCNIPISELAQSSKIPMVTPTAPMPGLTYHMGHRKDYVFCDELGDYLHGAAAAGLALENLKAKTAAVLYNQDRESGISLAEHFKEEFENGGGKVQLFKAYSLKDNSFAKLLKEIAVLRPDVMYFPDAYDRAGTIAGETREAGVKAVIYSGVVWDSDSIDLQAMEGAYCTDNFISDEPRPEVKEFVDRYFYKYNSRPDAVAALAYDATQIVLKAVEAANSSNPAKIKDALQNTKDFPAVTGKTSFDQNGSPVKPVAILQVKGGRKTYVTSVDSTT